MNDAESQATFADPRFVLTLVVVLLATVLACAKLPGREIVLTGDQWVATVTWALSAFLLGKAAGAFASGYAAKSVAAAQAVKS